MPPTVEGRPSLPAVLVARRVREAYGLEGTLQPLATEWDQNFRLDTDRAGSFVVKLANAGTATEELELQNAALEWLGRHWRPAAAPRVVSSSSGEAVCTLAGEEDAPTRMRLLTHLPGAPLSSLPVFSVTLLERLGDLLGDLDSCLVGFEHPAMDRRIEWDLCRAEWISSSTSAIRDLERRRLVERLLLQFRARVVPLLPHLPMSVIHNDANDENVLVEPDGGGEWRPAGLIDFGDMVRTCTVCEPAIAAAYATFGADDPLTAIAAVEASYHGPGPSPSGKSRCSSPSL